MDSNFTNLLRLPGNVPPPRIGKVAVKQRPLVEGGSIISIAFMFSKAETSGGRWAVLYNFYSIHV